VLIDEALTDRSARPDDLRAILRQLRANSQETERLIDALLVLARTERGVDRWSQVDLASVVNSVVDQSAPEAASAGVTVSSSLAPAVVSGDPGLLERLAGNLVENAIRHNVTDGTVAVSTSALPGTGQAVLEVDNTGPWLPHESVEDLVEPFQRAGENRASNDGGVGLGLSIVDAVVAAHHGTMTLTARPEGGLNVRVQLPISELAGLSPPERQPPPNRRHRPASGRPRTARASR
jgi:signal transduction histidine kinase